MLILFNVFVYNELVLREKIKEFNKAFIKIFNEHMQLRRPKLKSLDNKEN